MDTEARLALIGGGRAVEFLWLPALRRIGWKPVLFTEQFERHNSSTSLLKTISRDALKISDWHSCADQFDAALVTSPHAQHGEAGLALLQAGKHVFLEAPIALNAEQYSLMIDVAEREGMTLASDLRRRRIQIFKWTKAILKAEVLGDIVNFEVREGTIFKSDARSDVSYQPNALQGGVLTDLGAHTLDLLCWWLGEISVLQYQDDNVGRFEAECLLRCELATGGSGQIHFSRIRELRNVIRIEGSKGFLELDTQNCCLTAGSPNVLAFRFDGILPEKMKFSSYTDLLAAQLSDFRRTISMAEPKLPEPEVKQTVQLIEHCYTARRNLIKPWRDPPARTEQTMAPKLPSGSIIAVTGATGFIGGRLVERLVADGHAHVRCIVRHLGRTANLARLPVELISLDLNNSDELSNVLEGADYVFHCAYDVHSPQNNVGALENLVSACSDQKVKRLIHVSTFAVYEPFKDGTLTEQTSRGDRSNMYVDTKLTMEDLVLKAPRNGGVATTVIQPAIVYGPFCAPWTNTPAEMLLLGEVILPDLGEGLCNAVYIDDLVDSLKLAAVCPEALGERFIISGPEPITWATFFREFARALGTNPPQYWPSERLNKADETARSILVGLFRPKEMAKMFLRWKPLRSTLLKGLAILPEGIKLRTKKYYFNSFSRSQVRTFIPTGQKLALYKSKASAGSEKARVRLGYTPQFSFSRGMNLTADYLQWAYEDTLCADLKGTKK